MKTFKTFLTEVAIPPQMPRREILSKVYSIGSSIIGKELTLKQITSTIAKELKKRFPVIVNFETVSHLDDGDITVNAFYDYEADEDGDDPFEIVIVFSSKNKSLTISETGWKYLADALSAALEHEMVHQSQYQIRGYIRQRDFTKHSTKVPKVMKVQSYLGNDDEIGAFALNISHELLNSYQTKEAVLNALRNFTSIDMQHSMNLWVYTGVFGKDHQVIKSLLKKVVQYIHSI